MTSAGSLSDAELAGLLTQILRGWTQLADQSAREALLLKASLDRRLLRDLPFDAPLENFAPILAHGLVAATGTDPANLESVSRFVWAIRDVTKGSDAESVIAELKRRGTAPSKFQVAGQRSAPPEMRTYLKGVVSSLGVLDTGFLGPSVPNQVMIDRLYVPLPTGATLRAAVDLDGNVRWEVQGAKFPPGFKGASGDGGPLRVPRLAEALVQVEAAMGDQPGALPGEANRPLVLRPLGAGGASFHVETFRVEEVVAQFGRVLLIGAPGGGKSIAARHTAVAIAQERLGAVLPGTSSLTSLVPIFVSVNALTRWEHFVATAAEPDADVITAFVNAVAFGGDQHREEELRRLAVDGELILTVDGLDEVWVEADDDERRIDRRALLAVALERFLSRYERTPALITCRPEAEARFWPSLADLGFSSVALPPLGTDHAEMLADNVLKLTGAANREELKDRIRTLWSEGVEAVLSVPLYVVLFAASLSADPRGGVKLSRSALLGEAVRLLAIRWSSSRSAVELHGDPNAVINRPEAEKHLIDALQRIALRSLTEGYLGNEVNAGVDMGEILRELTYFRSGLYAAFTYLVEESGLFEEAGAGRYRFRLRPFEEYLGAAELVHEGGQALSDLRGAMGAHPERWLEPMALACDLLAARLGPDAAAAALGDVVLDWSGGENLQAWPYLWLAATSIERLVDDHGLTTDTGTCDRLRGRVRRGYPQGPFGSHFGRFRVGEVIARMGDPRTGVGLNDDNAPAFDWLWLPAGSFVMGTSDAAQQILDSQPWAAGWTTAYEQPANEVTVDAFAISRFPVTVYQFRSFLVASDGYRNDVWWQGLAPPDTEPPNLPSSDRRRSDPVSNVNWYDAVAFCRWASHALGQSIRLPTEPEWEYASRGSGDDPLRIFPWGEFYDGSRTNGLDSGLGRPSPVGLYSIADGAWGDNTPLDMSGNVWEWCTTIHSAEDGREFRYPYVSSDGREALMADDTHRRVVRGGSYTNLPFSLRTTMRGHDRPSLRASRQGFRVVRDDDDPGDGNLRR